MKILPHHCPMLAGWLQPHCDCAILQRGLRSPPLIRRPAPPLPWSPPRFYLLPINPSTVLLNLSPQIHCNSGSSNLHTSAPRGSSPVFNIQTFSADRSHTPKCSHHHHNNNNRKLLLSLLLVTWLCPKFLIFLPQKLRPWTSLPTDNWGWRRSLCE